MLLLGLALELAALGVAVFPRWRHSARWGYGPSVTIGILLFFVALLAAGGKSNSIEAIGDRLDQPQRMVMRRPDIGVAPELTEEPVDNARPSALSLEVSEAK